MGLLHGLSEDVRVRKVRKARKERKSTEDKEEYVRVWR